MKKYSLLGILVLCAPLSAPWASASLKPAWDCLPPETAFAVRIPNGVQFVDALHETRVGRHFFSEDVPGRVFELWRAEEEAGWETFERHLGEAGLTPEELPHLLQGESGAALVIETAVSGEGGRPALYGLVWLEPGEDLSGRALEGLLAVIEDRESERPAQRFDIDLAGREVHHFAVPQTVRDPDGGEVLTHHAHALMTRIEGRLLGALTIGSGPDSAEIRRFFEGNGELPAASDTEPGEAILGLFARFLQSHDREDGGGFSRELAATPGLLEAMPEGVPGLDIALHFDPLYEVLVESFSEEDVAVLLESFGIRDIRRAAFRLAMERHIMRSSAIVAAATPRRGLVEELFGQEPLAPRPPDWVGSGVSGYTHFSMDFGRLYARVKELVIEHGGDEVAMGFAEIETQIAAFTGAPLWETLSSLGNRHRILTFPMREMTDSAGFEAGNIFGGDHFAIVWELRNEAIWRQLLDGVAMLATMSGGAIQRAEEQGFSGWRLEAEGMEGGLFVGQEHLVLGMGPGVIEEVLSGLRRPPEAEYRFVGGERYRRAGELLNFRPGLAFDVQDSGRQFGELARMMLAAMEIEVRDDPAERRFFEFVSEMFNPDLLEEGIGVGASQTYSTDDGLISESVLELAP